MVSFMETQQKSAQTPKDIKQSKFLRSITMEQQNYLN